MSFRAGRVANASSHIDWIAIMVALNGWGGPFLCAPAIPHCSSGLLGPMAAQA